MQNTFFRLKWFCINNKNNKNIFLRKKNLQYDNIINSILLSSQDFLYHSNTLMFNNCFWIYFKKILIALCSKILFLFKLIIDKESTNCWKGLNMKLKFLILLEIIIKLHLWRTIKNGLHKMYYYWQIVRNHLEN